MGIVRSKVGGAIFCLLCLAGSPAAGRTVQWFCDPGGSKLFADGSALDATVRFELGVFTGGFVPSVANRSEWAAHWVAAQRVGYYPPTAVFSGTVTVTGNDALFGAGAKAYIWGFTGDLENGEWILARESSWTWPTPAPFQPIGPEWKIGLATEVLAGTVHASGSPFLLQTEVVADSVPPTTTWTQWQQDELDGESADEPSDDPDHDGLSNLEEYAAGTSPLSGASRVPVLPSVVTLGLDRHLAISVPLRADREVDLEIGVSVDLVNWSFDPAPTVIESETAAMVAYRSIESLDLVQRQFLKARLRLAP